MGLKLFEVVLHTGKETSESLRSEFGNVTDKEIQNYLKILKAMDGQKAIVSLSFSSPDEYDYIGLIDRTQCKEVSYLMEQDPMMGCYIDQREEFNRDYDSGNYCPSDIWTLKKEYVKIVKPIPKKKEDPKAEEATNEEVF